MQSETYGKCSDIGNVLKNVLNRWQHDKGNIVDGLSRGGYICIQ